MPYIGKGPSKSGAFRIIDDISGSFNGSTTSFALEVDNTALTVGLPETLLIAVDGVVQEAGSAYTISGSNIVFTAAPQADATFWGVELGDVGGIAQNIVDGAITPAKLDHSTNSDNTKFLRHNGSSTDPSWETVTTANDTAYASSWNGVTDTPPSKNAVYDKVETLAPLADPVFTSSIKITAASAPGSPSEGQIYYNTTDKKAYIYNGGWKALNDAPQNSATVSGAANGSGDIYNAGNYTYRYHIFNGNGTFTPNQAFDIEYLVIAGGGGGGAGWRGGGGGAGGYRCSVPGEKTGGGGTAENPLSVTAQSYTVTVGAAGTAGSSGDGGDGGNSIISVTSGGSAVLTATGGGGGGGNYAVDADGAAGGSGGGGGGRASDPGEGGAASSPTQGYAGGDGLQSTTYALGGGGGGAGGVGQNASPGNGATDGDGGVGLSSSITGSAVRRGGGGGGGGYESNTNAAVGVDGGGNGGVGNPASPGAVAGSLNTGGGGGGQSTTADGAAGGTGVIIIRYIYAENVPLPQATSAEILAGDNVDKFVSPDLLFRSLGVAKAYCRINQNGIIEAEDYNIASITDTGTGDRTVVFDNDFDNERYAWGGSVTMTVSAFLQGGTTAVGSQQIKIANAANTVLEDRPHTAIFCGELA